MGVDLRRPRTLRNPRGLSESDPRGDCFLDFFDVCLISPVKGPLFDAFRADQPGLLQNLQVFAGGGLADAQLSCEEQAANSIFDQVSVHLRRKVCPWILQPFQDSQPARTGQCGECKVKIHIDN